MPDERKHSFFSIKRLKPVLEYSSRIDFKVKNNLIIFLEAIKFRHPWLSPIICSWHKDDMKLLMDRIFRAHANEGRTTREETCAEKYSRTKREINLAFRQTNPKNEMNKRRNTKRVRGVSLRYVVPEIASKTTQKHTIM